MLQLNHENEMGQVTFLGKGQKVTRNTVLSVHLMGGEENGKLTVASSARSRPCSGRASSAAGSGLSLKGSPAPRR